MNIVEALDEIDILFANELNSNNKFENKETVDKIYNALVSIKEYVSENDKLQKRYQVLSNAFISITNGENSYKDIQIKQDAQNYFAWLQGEKNIASNPSIKISKEEAIRLIGLAKITGHKPRNEIAEVVKNLENTKNETNLPKKISFIDKIRGKINNFFKVKEKKERKTRIEDIPIIPKEEVKKENVLSYVKVNTPQPELENIQKKENKRQLIVISDLHGNMNKWNYVKNALEKNPKMKVIIEGDAMDRGNDGLQILLQIKELCSKGRAEYIPGNHDAFAYNTLMANGTKYENENIIKQSRKTWEVNGGITTKNSFENFDDIVTEELRKGNIKSRITKAELVSWLGKRPLQKVVYEGDKKYALGHAVFDKSLYMKDPEFNLEKALVLALQGKEKSDTYNRYQNIMWYRENDKKTHFSQISFPKDYVMVVGHTKQRNANLQYLENDKNKPIIYLDCGKGELQGFDLVSGKHIQLEPERTR